MRGSFAARSAHQCSPLSLPLPGDKRTTPKSAAALPLSLRDSPSRHCNSVAGSIARPPARSLARCHFLRWLPFVKNGPAPVAATTGGTGQRRGAAASTPRVGAAAASFLFGRQRPIDRDRLGLFESSPGQRRCVSFDGEFLEFRNSTTRVHLLAAAAAYNASPEWSPSRST